jgi:protein-tyrosine phosphatase
MKRSFSLSAHCQPVTDDIWIGDLQCISEDLSILKSNGVDVIINASDQDYYIVMPEPYPFQLIRFPILDEELEKSDHRKLHYLREITKSTINVMEQKLSEGKKILVHCTAGINRSAYLIASFLVSKRNLTFDFVMEQLRDANNRRRGVPVLYNKTFVAEVKAMEH